MTSIDQAAVPSRGRGLSMPRCLSRAFSPRAGRRCRGAADEGQAYLIVACTVNDPFTDGSFFAVTSICSCSAPAFARAASTVTVIVSFPFGGSLPR